MTSERATGDRKDHAGSALGAAAAGTGASLLAGVASACCVGPALAPLIVGALGAGGAAWAAGLAPYSPYLLAGSAVLLAYTFRVLYAPAECDPADGTETIGPHDQTRRGTSARWMRRLAKAVAWLAALLWLAALGANLIFR